MTNTTSKSNTTSWFIYLLHALGRAQFFQSPELSILGPFLGKPSMWGFLALMSPGILGQASVKYTSKNLCCVKFFHAAYCLIPLILLTSQKREMLICYWLNSMDPMSEKNNGSERTYTRANPKDIHSGFCCSHLFSIRNIRIRRQLCFLYLVFFLKCQG